MSKSKKLRVIVIDDDSSISHFFKMLLSGLGCHVLTFPDPTVWLTSRCHCSECVQESPCFDIVLSDVMMPKMDGIDFLRLLKNKNCKAQSSNMALMSASENSRQKSAVKELGCHFFKKPFRLTEITDWLQECAERLPT